MKKAKYYISGYIVAYISDKNDQFYKKHLKTFTELEKFIDDLETRHAENITIYDIRGGHTYSKTNYKTWLK